MQTMDREEAAIWDQVWSHLSLHLDHLTALQRAVAASVQNASSRLQASETRAASLKDAVEHCRIEFSTIITATSQLEVMLGEVGSKGESIKLRQRDLELLVSEAGAVCGIARAEIAALATDIELLESAVSLLFHHSSTNKGLSSK